MFGFYHSKPDRLKVWKVSSVFGRKMMQVDVSKLQEQFQPYQGKGQKVLKINHSQSRTNQ